MREFDSTLPSISVSSLIPVLHHLSSQRPPPARLDALKVVDQDSCRSGSDQPQSRRKVQVGQARCPRADRSVARRPRGSSESPAVQGRERRVGSNKLERGCKEGRLRRRQGVLPELGAGHHRPTRRNEYHCRWFVLLLSTSHFILADLSLLARQARPTRTWGRRSARQRSTLGRPRAESCATPLRTRS